MVNRSEKDGKWTWDCLVDFQILMLNILMNTRNQAKGAVDKIIKAVTHKKG